jgi:hypothetical protein
LPHLSASGGNTAEVKTFSIIRVVFLYFCFAVSLNAREVITCKSPDGKFALRHSHAEQQPYAGDTAIIEASTKKVVMPLTSNREISQLALVWSSDSKRVAYYHAELERQQTRVFFRTRSSFNEIKLPELPSPRTPPVVATTDADAKTSTRIQPIEWFPSGDLLLEKELQNPTWGRAALKITLGFDKENRCFVRQSEQEKMSIVDYFLLLPEDQFEGRPSTWLNHARTGGAPYLCKGEPGGGIVDEKNGYISCGGSGAQSSFEVALFRHRNGRPLLALAEGGAPEEEGPLSVYLKFFELGVDGKMHETTRSIFPIPDSWEDRWQFILPREGRTILVREPKSKKILHRFTWDGENFREEK